MSYEDEIKESIKKCNFFLRCVSVLFLISSLIAGLFSAYPMAAWMIGLAVFFRIIANEGSQ